MAAAGLAAALGGTNAQAENAAEIGLEHNLGLTCDLIGGPGRGGVASRRHLGRVAPLARRGARRFGQRRADARHARPAWADAQKETLHAAEQDRPDVAAARAQWKEQQPSLAPGRLFFLDETSVKTNMVREHGWAPRGERLVTSAPHGHRKTSTFIDCLHQGGMVAPYVLDGAVNGELFVAYIEQQVVPSLARGDALIMDNSPVHKAAGVRKALDDAGIALLFLPAYSPDLNPIEMVFAKTTALLRKAAIRTVDALWRALSRISQFLTREECVNYFRHCGYVQSG